MQSKSLHRFLRIYGRNDGQGTLEYALVLFALMAIITTLYVWWKYVSDGTFMNRVVLSLSHALPWGVVDVLGY